MSIRKVILAMAVSSAFVPAAFASSGAIWVGGEAGYVTHALEGGLSREQVRAELDAFLSAGGVTGSGETGYRQPPHQHTYTTAANGQRVHDDKAVMGNVGMLPASSITKPLGGVPLDPAF